MKPFLPTSLLFVGMFVAGCHTPENSFMAGDLPLVTKPAAPVAKVAPPKPAAPVVVVPPPKPEPVAPKPVVVAPNPPPVVAPTNAAPVAPADATPVPVKPAEAPVAPAVTLPTIVLPDTSIAGKVVVYNSTGRFVVLGFPDGPMPRQDQSMFLYRGGLKVGEIKITGPQRDSNTVGDVVNGDAQVGDEARDR